MTFLYFVVLCLGLSMITARGKRKEEDYWELLKWEKMYIVK